MSIEPTEYQIEHTQSAYPFINPYEEVIPLPPPPPNPRHRWVLIALLVLVLTGFVGVALYMANSSSVHRASPPTATTAPTPTLALPTPNVAATVNTVRSQSYIQGINDEQIKIKLWLEQNCHYGGDGFYTVWYSQGGTLNCACIHGGTCSMTQ